MFVYFFADCGGKVCSDDGTGNRVCGVVNGHGAAFCGRFIVGASQSPAFGYRRLCMRGDMIRMVCPVRCGWSRVFPWNASEINTRVSSGGDSECFDNRQTSVLEQGGQWRYVRAVQVYRRWKSRM